MGNKKLAIFSIVIFVVSLLIFGATLYLTIFKNNGGQPKPPKTYTCDLGNFSTNIGASGRYFKGNIVVETTGKKTPDLITKNQEPIRAYILKLLISQDIKQMTTDQGIDNLSGLIRKEVARVTGTDDITNVYFTEYIIQ
ncbi:MAG: flagellar basal body-associated FliL family protein [Peptostreptococcaceae bacterium]|nr:flagellar basal body-associated FliL family protein [Peptostreptococcaceae bacterium]